jgi:hypothetical protein
MKHKIYISYQNDENMSGDYWLRQDFKYKKHFEELCADRFDIVNIDSLESEDTKENIRKKHLKDSTVTIVLIGVDTWRQKNIDWEISASLERIEQRNGLIGILLPTYKKYFESKGKELYTCSIDEGFGYYDKRTIPERLMLNLENKYAKVYDWINDSNTIHKWVNEAHYRRHDVEPENDLPLFRFDRKRFVG